MRFGVTGSDAVNRLEIRENQVRWSGQPMERTRAHSEFLEVINRDLVSEEMK